MNMNVIGVALLLELCACWGTPEDAVSSQCSDLRRAFDDRADSLDCNADFSCPIDGDQPWANETVDGCVDLFENAASCEDLAAGPAYCLDGELCETGWDDDGDGLVDCEDPDCEGHHSC